MGSSSPPQASTPSDDDRHQDAMWEVPTHLRILVSEDDAGRIIGKAGSSIKAIEARSGANIKLSKKGEVLPGTNCRLALLSGLFNAVMDAADLILEKIIFHGDQVIDADATVVFVVPEACCGALIGKAGAVIKSLAEESNAGITISPYDICYGFGDRLVTITGNLDNQLQAIFLILSELIDNVHYSSYNACVSFPRNPGSSVGRDGDGQDEHVERYHSRSRRPMGSPNVNNSNEQGTLAMGVAEEYMGAVIGIAGRTIQEIKRVTGVWIRTSGKGNLIPGTSNREVVIRGTREAVDAAEAMIMQRVSDAARRPQQGGGGDRRPVKQVEQYRQ